MSSTETLTLKDGHWLATDRTANSIHGNVYWCIKFMQDERHLIFNASPTSPYVRVFAQPAVADTLQKCPYINRYFVASFL